MNHSSYSNKLNNSCCVPGAYNGFNLQAANPFDKRNIPNQANKWCSNELILKDKAMRCAARIQPLDILHAKATSVAYNDAKAKGLW